MGWSAAGGGAVHALYGSAEGLTTTGAQLLTQDSPGVGSTAEEFDSWGRQLAVGDFDGDAYDDVAVGDPEEDVGNVELAGAVTVLPGSPEGVTGRGSRLFTQANLGVGRPAEESALFGRALAAGNLDGSGPDDLAIGVPGARVGGVDTGAVSVVYSAPGGLGAGANQYLHQNSPGVGGTAEPVDVNVVAAVAGRLDGVASQVLTEDIAAGESEPYDHFGYTLIGSSWW